MAIKKKPKEKSKAQIFLERVELIDAIVPNKLIEQKQWRELAQSITANMEGEKVQSSGSQSKLADAVARCVDMEGEILAAVEKLIAEKGKVIATMEKLDNPMEYKILHMRYIQYIELCDIADMLRMEYTNVTTIHGRACKHIQVIMDK